MSLAVQAAAEQVQSAWINAGPEPFVHAAAQIRLHDEWPALVEALVNLSNILDAQHQAGK